MLNKTLKVAAGLCLMATTAWAQLPQTVNFESVKVSKNLVSEGVSAEALKKNFEWVKERSLAAPKIGEVNRNIVLSPSLKMTGIKQATPKVMTRVGEFGAYYTLPTGVYNLKPGVYYGQQDYCTYGILAPAMEEVIYKNASTGAVNFDWFINETLVMNEDTLSTVYVPIGGTSWWTPMPELTAYAANGQDSIYQYGWGLDPYAEEAVERQGQAVTAGSGFIQNMDAYTITWMNAVPMVGSEGTWADMMFGSSNAMKPSYIELFDKPIGTLAFDYALMTVATPDNAEISDKEFSVSVLVVENGAWKEIATAKGKPQYQGSIETPYYNKPFASWSLAIPFDEMVMMNQDFALLLEGPQDGETPWAFLCDWTRDINGRATAGFIPSEGEYAGQIMFYGIQPDGYSEPVAFPTSMDVALGAYTPFNIFFDPESGYSINMLNNDTVSVGGGDVIADMQLLNWETWNFGPSDCSLKITSNVDWLNAKVTKTPSDENISYMIQVNVKACPEGNRFGTLTFTDGRGYNGTLTFYQEYDAEGVEEIVDDYQKDLDLSKPVYDLTGRRVYNPQNGIYLQNGKKFVVK